MPQPKLDDQTVYLVDGSGYIFRAYFAIRNLRSRKGVPTNAVFGFTNMLLKLIRDHDPKYIAIAFDTKAPTFRHEIYDGYKANRPSPPEDLVPQFALIHQVVDCLGIKRLVKDGFEADDIIGTLATQARAAGREVVVVTGDKDFMQLVDDGVFLLDELRAARGDVEKFIDEAGVLAEMGVLPKHIIDLLALMGDSSDNVPGVSGIGKKTAVELICEFGPTETIFNMLPLIKQDSRRQKLMDGRALAALSKDLVRIKTDVPLNEKIADLAYLGIDKEATRKLFFELDFNRLLNDKKIFGDAEQPAMSLPSVGLPPVPSEINIHAYQAITDSNALEQVLTKLANSDAFALDTETDSLDSMTASLVGVSLAFGKNEAAYIPIAHDPTVVPKSLSVAQVREALNPILKSAKIIVAQNAKYDYKVLVRHGFFPFRIGGDPMLASYLLHQDLGSHSLDNLSKKYLQHKPISYEEVCGEKKSQIPFSKVSLTRATEYAGEDADLALRLHKLFLPELKDKGLAPLYHDIELPLEEVLARMEMRGVLIDTSKLSGIREEINAKLVALTAQAHTLAGEEFNLASPRQVGEILFEKLKLAAQKKGKSGFSTDAGVLEKLALSHPLPQVILDFRMYAKLMNTYVDILPTLVNPSTGRVHTSYNQFVAATGRLSSSDPNLQNIPIRTSEGRRIREAFIAREGYSLISLDYSQVELRLLAYASRDPVLLDAFARDEDVHRRTASEIFDVPQSEVTKEQRSAAKTINFGLLYGMGVLRLSQTLNISRQNAAVYLAKYFEKLGGILAWKDETLKKAKEAGEVRTFFGRLRKLEELSSKNSLLRSRGERIAINTPIQGTAADIIKIAMIKTDEFLTARYPDSHLIMQVHDELVIEAKTADAKAIAEHVSGIMRHSHGLDLDLKVEYGIGSSWDAAH